MGLVAALETPDHLAGYAAHPAHLEYVATKDKSAHELTSLTEFRR